MPTIRPTDFVRRVRTEVDQLLESGAIAATSLDVARNASARVGDDYILDLGREAAVYAASRSAARRLPNLVQTLAVGAGEADEAQDAEFLRLVTAVQVVGNTRHAARRMSVTGLSNRGSGAYSETEPAYVWASPYDARIYGPAASGYTRRFNRPGARLDVLVTPSAVSDLDREFEPFAVLFAASDVLALVGALRASGSAYQRALASLAPYRIPVLSPADLEEMRKRAA